jgi:hypothetical protein
MIPKRLSDIESLLIYVYFSIFYFKIKKRGFSWGQKNKKTSKSRLYIFGSGYSLNSISDMQWRKIRNTGDTLSFNDFYYSKFIDLDYYIFREVDSKHFKRLPRFLRVRLNSIFNISKIKSIHDLISGNSTMKQTKYLFLCDKKSGIALLYYMLFRSSINLFGFFSNPYDRTINWPISETPLNITHGAATLLDAINIGYIMGYTELVLCGVDLYDRNYFYLEKDETRDFDKNKGYTARDIHNTSHHIIETLSLWKPELYKRGVKVSVLNEKSLLNSVFDIYNL